MSKPRILLGSLLAIAAALPVVTPNPAEARFFFGLGLGFPGFGYGFGGPFYAPYYYPPPVVYAPPPPIVYAPPPPVYGYAVPPMDGAPSHMARCVAQNVICPLPYVKPVGAACSCPDAAGNYVNGQVG